ncbi:hypothetical protein CsatB_019364 [Cannabis sativa]
MLKKSLEFVAGAEKVTRVAVGVEKVIGVAAGARKVVGISIIVKKLLENHRKLRVNSTATPAVTTPAAGSRTSSTPVTKWQPPPENKFKLNVDAALDSSRTKIGIGVIVWNSDGQVVGAMSKPAVCNFKSQEMEAKAMFVGLSWAKQYQIPVDYVETDCLMLVNALNGCISQNLGFFDLVSDVTFHLSFFSNVCVSHIKRDANQAAHGLARQALQLDNNCIWLEEIPSTIFSVVVNDSM